MLEPRVLHVGEYLTLVNETLRLIPSADLAIEGEVSDYRVSQGKWVSFDLKDEEANAVLKCFTTVWKVKVPVESGMRVRIKGYPKIYEPFGSFKMNVEEVELSGEGALARAYQLLKEKLEKEGLFDVSRKRTLPRFVKKIGLITSREAAAYGDFLRILNNRWGGVEVMHAHVHVQGKNAVPEITSAFVYFNGLPESDRPDVLVLTRGGGGLEDLHAFNDESIARAVYASKIPVVCAVGHERDESLCDFVADIRASTPSNAAERIVPRREDVQYEIEMMVRRQEDQLNDQLLNKKMVLDGVARAMQFVLTREQERFRRLVASLQEGVNRWLPFIKDRLIATERLLRTVDPTRVLDRGFALVRQSGKIIRDTSGLKIGQEIQIEVAGGGFDAEVIRVNGKGRQKLL